MEINLGNMEEDLEIEIKSSDPLGEVAHVESNLGNMEEDLEIESSDPSGEDDEQPQKSTATYSDVEPEDVMEEVLHNWRMLGLKFSAADEEFLESSRKKFGREDWPWKEESSEAAYSLKPAAAVEKQTISETYRLKAEELKRRAMVLKRRSDLLHLVLSYPMKAETSKQSQPCLGSNFSDINQTIKQLENLMFDESSSSAAPGEGDDIINNVQELFDEVEEDLGKFDFEIAPYLEKQPLKAATADVEKGSGSTSTKHVDVIVDDSTMPATIDEQSENAPSPSPVMHKLAIDFAVRQILEFFEGRRYGMIGISGRGWEQVLVALKDAPNITSMFDFVQNVSLDQHQSMLELHVNVLRQLNTKSNEDYFARFLLLVDSIDQEIDLDCLNNLNICTVFRSRPQRANELLQVDLEIRMEDHLLPWNLFCKKAGRLLLSSTTLQRTAEHFIEQSRGHLLVIILLTKALPNEMDPSIWNLVLRNQQPAVTVVHDQVDAMMINVLRFIWERLDSTTKNCIKCFVTPKKEKKEITKDSLIGLWISSGWIDKSEEGLPVFKKLIDYLFLEDVGRGHFRMREEIKLGLLNTFVSGKHLQDLEKGGLVLIEPPEAEKWNAEKINLMDNKIFDLPESPNCSVLVKLELQYNYDLMVIPSSFFNCMPILEVLDLSFTSIKYLPESISKLILLRKFFLRGCDLLTKLPPEIGALKRLEEFDLKGTYLLYLPKEIGELVNLTHLKVCLSGCANLFKEHMGVDTVVPRKALSNLHQLKQLSIDVLPDGDWWDVEVRAIVNEVCGLSHLEELELYLPTAKTLKEVRSYRSLKKFRLIVGYHEQYFISRLPHEVEEEFNNSEKLARGLKYINGEGKPIKEITNVIAYADAFSLERHWTVKNLSEFGHKNMKNLQFCCLVGCNEVQTIIDVKEDYAKNITYFDDIIVLDDLKYLSVYSMKSMHSFCKVPTGQASVIMPQLNSLALHTCPSLSTIFTPAILRNLTNLKELIVEDCPNITSLVTPEDSTSCLGYFLPSLKKISLLVLPKLVSISSGMCIAPELEMMIIFHCPRLQMLSSTDVSSKDLKAIKADREWWTALRWHESDWSSGRQYHLASIFIPLDMVGDLKGDIPAATVEYVKLAIDAAVRMGNQLSTKSPETSTAINFNNNLQYTTELNSYKAACRLDQDLQYFDTSLQARTNQVINTLAVGVEVRALSFDSLKEVTEYLLEMNQEVVKVILECKKDIWKNQELFELVGEYFENSLQTLDFCTALEKCLKRARDSQLLILVALQQFEEEEQDGVEGKRYVRTLEELKNSKAASDPFTEEFIQIFQSVYRQQRLMLDKLQLKKKKLDKKLKDTHAWRKVSSIIFVATFAAVLICSVMAAAMAAPPVAAALAAATSIPLGSMGKWIDSLLKNYENAVKGQKEVLSSMQAGTYVAIKDLNNLRVLIDRLEIEIELLLTDADFAIKEEAVKVTIDEIKKKLGVFMQNVEDFGVQADMCSRDIRRARTVVLQRIIKHPNH